MIASVRFSAMLLATFLLFSASLQIIAASHQDDERELIVGGSQVESADDYPFFASYSNCGGTVIHDDLVLTAAHCGNQNGRLWFRHLQWKHGFTRDVIDRVKHPRQVDGDHQDYDYMILKLDSSVLVDSANNPTGAKAIEINSDPEVPADNDPVWIVGFGASRENGKMSSYLNHAQIYKATDATCSIHYGEVTYQRDRMFCSGIEGGGTDVCRGDSGGPVVDATRTKLLGFVGFSVGCAWPDRFGVNQRVSYEYEWLQEQICTFSSYPPASCNGGTDESAAAATTTATSPPTSAPPTKSPTNPPTRTPTTSSPTNSPSDPPTTSSPTNSPSNSPTTSSPTNSPSDPPTTGSPTNSPSNSPSTGSPTNIPSNSPTTGSPTSSPTTVMLSINVPPVNSTDINITLDNSTNYTTGDDDDIFTNATITPSEDQEEDTTSVSRLPSISAALPSASYLWCLSMVGLLVTIVGHYLL